MFASKLDFDHLLLEMKKFFQKLKSDYKFKKAGPGQKLSDPSSSQSYAAQSSSSTSAHASSQRQEPRSAESESARNAAREAAMARLAQKAAPGNKVNRAVMKKAREEAQTARENADLDRQVIERMQAPKEEKVDQTFGVYYECPLSQEIVLKAEYIRHLESFLQQQWDGPICPLPIAIMKIRLLNTNRGKLDQFTDLNSQIIGSILA